MTPKRHFLTHFQVEYVVGGKSWKIKISVFPQIECGCVTDVFTLPAASETSRERFYDDTAMPPYRKIFGASPTLPPHVTGHLLDASFAGGYCQDANEVSGRAIRARSAAFDRRARDAVGVKGRGLKTSETIIFSKKKCFLTMRPYLTL